MTERITELLLRLKAAGKFVALSVAGFLGRCQRCYWRRSTLEAKETGKNKDGVELYTANFKLCDRCALDDMFRKIDLRIEEQRAGR